MVGHIGQDAVFDHFSVNIPLQKQSVNRQHTAVLQNRASTLFLAIQVNRRTVLAVYDDFSDRILNLKINTAPSIGKTAGQRRQTQPHHPAVKLGKA